MRIINALRGMMLLGCLHPAPGTAYDVLVSVSANFIGNTCVLSAESKDLTVPLGTIGTRQFVNAGDVSNISAPFSLKLEECGPTFTGVKLRFNATPDTDNPQLIRLAEGGASGIGVQLLDSQREIIPPGVLTQTYGNAGSESVELQFYARLAATGSPVVPGTVAATATWIMEYQ